MRFLSKTLLKGKSCRFIYFLKLKFKMKKISYLIVFSIITLISCERNEIAKSNDYAVIENIKSKAANLSYKHDSLVLEMLRLEKQKKVQKAKSTNNVESKLNLHEMLDVIQEVTGVKPVVLNADDIDDANRWQIKSKVLSDAPVVNLDNQYIRMSDYAQSELSKQYLESIDDLLQDSENRSYDNIVAEINKVQNEIISDNNATKDDIQLVINSTEVLKGSLKIWDSVLPIGVNQVNNSKSLISSALNWPRWLKWVFIGAADAVGGTISWFSGATITIMNVPIYLPPGPVGAAGGAAAVSVLATIIAFQ